MAFGSHLWTLTNAQYSNWVNYGGVAGNDTYLIVGHGDAAARQIKWVNYAGVTATTKAITSSGVSTVSSALDNSNVSYFLFSWASSVELFVNAYGGDSVSPLPSNSKGGAENQLGNISSSSGSPALSMHGMFCDTLNNNALIFSDITNHKIICFNNPSPLTANSMTYNWSFGTQGNGTYQFQAPQGVWADATRIYVADTGNHRVMVYAKSDRRYLGTIGGYGTGNSQFNTPVSVAADPFYIYVLDRGNSKVKRFDINTFAFVDSFGSPGTGTGELDPYVHQLYVNYAHSRIVVASPTYGGVQAGRVICFENSLPTYLIFTMNTLLQDAISGADISLTLKPQISAGQPYVDVQIKPTISAEGWGHMNTINQPMLNFLDIEAFGYEQSCNMIIKPSLLIGTDQILLSFFPEILIGTTNLNQALDFEFQAAAAEAITGEIDLDIKFQLTVAGPVAGNGSIEIELATDGFGAIDPHGTGVATLTLQAIGHAGSFGETTLPSLETSGFGYVIATGTGEAVISLAAVGTGIADAIATGIAVIEGLTTFSQGFISPLGSTEGIALQLRASGVGYAGTVGRGSIVLPRVETEGAGYLIGPGTAAIEFTLIVRGTGDYAEGGQTVTLVPVMNTRNAAVTEFSLPLFDITEVDGHIYATDGTNVYELMTGTSDNSAAITSSFASAVSDTHLANVRLVREVYTNTRTTGPMSLTVTTDEGRNEYTYAVLPTQTNRMHGIRTKCGRGLRGRFLKLRYSTQASFELDKSRLLVEPIRYRER